MERLTYLNERGQYRLVSEKDHSFKFMIGTNEQEALNKLASYEDAEEDGRLIVLPCKVGDTVYSTDWSEGLQRDAVFVYRVQGISVAANNKDVILHFGGYPFTNVWGSDIGKTVFLTREEAEAALAAMEGREDEIY